MVIIKKKLFLILPAAALIIAILLVTAYYLARPKICSIEPLHGYQGTLITIHGSNFSRESNSIAFTGENKLWRDSNTAYLNRIPSPDGKTLTFEFPELLGACPSPKPGIQLNLFIPVVCPAIGIHPASGEYQVKVLTRWGTSRAISFTVESEEEGVWGCYELWGEKNIWNQIEFNKPTNKWFFPSPFGAFISEYDHRPGDEVNIQINHFQKNIPELEVELKIISKLTERDPEWNLVKVLKEETTILESWDTPLNLFSANLPEKYRANYLLSAELIDEEGNILDTLLGHIHVPYRGVVAGLETDRSNYSVKDTATITIRNYGPTEILLNEAYFILEDETEERITISKYHWEKYLKPRDTLKKQIELEDFKPGNYSINFEVKGKGVEETIILTQKLIINPYTP